jgi:hypothetical protein
MDTQTEAGYAASWTIEGRSGEKTVTEEEWLACTELERLISYLKEANGKQLDRKARLFACACARQAWGRLHAQGQKAVEVAERFADGLATAEELTSIRNVGMDAWSNASLDWSVMVCNGLAVSLENGFSGALYAAKHTPEALIPLGSPNRKQAKAGARRAIHTFFIDIFGNPFRSVTVSSACLSWHDGLIVSMARQMYDHRDFTDMPILADALEEAGCTDQEILAHCRLEGEHVRGCWVVDLVMGKS